MSLRECVSDDSSRSVQKKMRFMNASRFSSRLNQAMAARTVLLNGDKLASHLYSNKTFDEIRKEFIQFLRNKMIHQQKNLSSISTLQPSTTQTSTIQLDTSARMGLEGSIDNETVSITRDFTRLHLHDMINIWKLAFFILLLIICLLSLLAVLTLVFKILLSKLKQTKGFYLNNGASELPVKKKKPLSLRRQISSLSFFDYNTKRFSMSKLNMIPPALKTHSPIVTISSMTSTTSNDMPPAVALSPPEPPISTIQSASDTIKSIGNLDERFIKSTSILDSIFDSRSSSCDNKSLADSISQLDDKRSDEAFVYTITKPNRAPPEVQLGAKKGFKIEIGVQKKSNYQSNFIPYRLTTNNDYDGVETESIGNFSSLTTFSEVNEDKNDSWSFNMNNNRLKDIDLMTMEKIEKCESSRTRIESKKMARELELKLKERRDLVEIDRFRPKILQEGDLMTSKVLASTTLPRKSVEKRGVESTATNRAKCLNFRQTPVKYEIVTKNESCVGEKITTITDSSATLNPAYKNPRIVIDNTHKLLAKRESIKMLIDNKLVTENKQKSDLENQLNALLKYKITNP